MFALLQALADLLARLGRRRRAGSAERTPADAEQAWALVTDPRLWPLWMPGVQTMLGSLRPPRTGARYHVALRPGGGPLGRPAGREGWVQLDRLEPSLLAWRLVAGRRVDRYELRRAGPTLVCQTYDGDDASELLAESTLR